MSILAKYVLVCGWWTPPTSHHQTRCIKGLDIAFPLNRCNESHLLNGLYVFLIWAEHSYDALGMQCFMTLTILKLSVFCHVQTDFMKDQNEIVMVYSPWKGWMFWFQCNILCGGQTDYLKDWRKVKFCRFYDWQKYSFGRVWSTH